MADKVFAVIGGFDNDMDYEHWQEENIECVCDSFESACNYIRKVLGDIASKEKDIYADPGDSYYRDDYATFEGYWKNEGYQYDPDKLPSNDIFEGQYVYRQGLGIEYYVIKAHEIKHYD